MPSNVVKTKADEKKWEKAKGLAEEQGQKDDYAYIMGIYKRMCPTGVDADKLPDHCKKKSSLRTALIKLAYDNPELRPDLLPILKEADVRDNWVEVAEDLVRDAFKAMKVAERIPKTLRNRKSPSRDLRTLSDLLEKMSTIAGHLADASERLD